MAFYSPLPDGSFQVERDDGAKVRTALQAPELEAMGLLAKPPELEQFERENTVAQNIFPEGGRIATDAEVRGAPKRQAAAPLDQVLQNAGIAPGEQVAKAGYATPPAKPQQQTIPVRPAQPAQQQQEPDTLDSLEKLALSQVVSSSAPRKGRGMVPVAQTIQKQNVAKPEDLKELDALEQENEAKQQEQVLRNAQDRGLVLDQAIAQNQQRELQLSKQFEQRAAVDRKLEQLNKYAEERETAAATMPTKSPTEEFFKGSGGTFARFVAAASLFASAFASGVTGMPNYAMQIFQDAIKERSETLKNEYDKAVAAGRTARNAYADALALYGTPEMAMQALNDLGEAIADRYMQLEVEKQANAQQMQQFEMMKMQRAEARKARWLQRNADAAGQVTTSFKNDTGSSGGTTASKEWVRIALDIRKERGKGKENIVRLPDGTVGYAAEGAAKDAQKLVVASNKVARLSRRILHLMEQPGSKSDAEKRGQLNNLIIQLQAAYKEGQNLGSYDDGTAKLLERFTGDPTELFSFGGTAAKLKEIESGALQDLEDVKQFQLGITVPPQSVKSDE